MSATATAPRLEYVPDDRYETSPKMPSGRPRTKQEVFAYWTHVLKDVKTDEEIKDMARGSWAWDYVWHVNFRQWDKHPDWTPGEPVIPEAVPVKPIPAGSNYIAKVEELWRLARRLKEERYG